MIDLVAPDGTSYRLKNFSGSDSADNVITTYSIDTSFTSANGIWRLRVKGFYAQDAGHIDRWRLTF